MYRLTPLLIALLLTGCFGGSGPAAQDAESLDAATLSAEQSTLDETSFVALSAEILCLPKKFPEAIDTEIEAKAEEIAKKYNASLEDYKKFKVAANANPQQKEQQALAIVGKMTELCPDTETVSAAVDTAPEPVEPVAAESDTPAVQAE